MNAYSEWRTADAARQVSLLLRIGFTAAPILFGIDKFFNWTVPWPMYLAPVPRAVGGRSPRRSLDRA